MFLALRKLGNICCGHKMFLNKIRNIFVSRIQNLCPQQMLRTRANRETFVSATMCPQQCVLVCQGLYVCPRPNVYWSNIEKKILSKAGAGTQPCSTPLLTRKASEVSPSKQTVLCSPSWKAAMMARRFGGENKSSDK